MSRVSLIEQLYAPKKKSALEFNYDALWAPPISFFLTQQDIHELYKIATSLKYNDNIEKKYELIDAIMKPRGFKRGNCGTNRVVYNFLEDTSFCMKIALDRVGIYDSPREYKNQEYFKPFCCKIFEVDPTGVIACVERVNPISSLEEFISISDDVYNMMVTKIIGKYVVDDLGADKFMNYGIRYNSNGVAFGPVVLDYPYVYELDGAKLHCTKPVQVGDKEFACGGEIDYDAGLNNLVCCKCGRHYSARELAKDDSNVIKFYSDEDGFNKHRMRARIVRADGTIIKDSGRSSKLYMTKEEYEEGLGLFELTDFGPRKVIKNVRNKRTPLKELRMQYHTDLQVKAYEEMQKRDEEMRKQDTEMKKKLAEAFNIEITDFEPRHARRAKAEPKTDEAEKVLENKNVNINFWYDIPRVRRARRAEDLGRENVEVVNKPKTEAEEPYIIKECKIDSVSLMQDGTIEPCLTDVKFESGNECDLNRDIAEVINEVINEEIHHEYPEEDTESDEFNKEMEADVFPEIAVNNITIGTELSNDVDYSGYEPPEEEVTENHESDNRYNDYNKYNTKHDRRNKKHNKNKKKYNINDDMTDY